MGFFLFYLSEGFELTIPTRCLTLIRPTQMQSERHIVRFKVGMLPITRSNLKEVQFVSVVKVGAGEISIQTAAEFALSQLPPGVHHIRWIIPSD